MDRLPPHAKPVFKGKIFEIWQWEQKMYDGSTATFESIKRPDTVEVVAVAGDKILIEEQEQPDRPEMFLSLPGGRVDQGGTPREEAMRELLEETGYEAQDWTLWKTAEPFYKFIYTVHFFIARDCKKIQEPALEAGEKITTKLVSFDEFLALSDNPRFRGTEFTKLLLRLRLDPGGLQEFKKLLFHKDS